MNKPKTFFDIYDETKPAEVLVENTENDEKLFTPEEEKKETFTLPEGFEETLINRISQAVIQQIHENAKAQADANAGGEGGTV